MKTFRFIVFTFLLTNFGVLPFGYSQDGAVDERMVRLIYLLPNDRQPQPDIDMKLDVLIKKVQRFYADEMERHGYGRKTFRFESDNNGNVIVHHVDGLYNDFYYRSNVGANIENIYGELQARFDFTQNIYIVCVEISTALLNEGTETEACGAGGEYGFGSEDGHGGHVYLPASGSCFEDLTVSAHELGHAFGLQHDFRDSAYVMSYGSLQNELSACAAHWLNVHPHFNPDKVLTRNANTIIDLLSHEFDATPPHALKIRFEINDPDGLVQAQLLTDTTGTSLAVGDTELVNCKALHDIREVVEFNTTRILNTVWIQVIDKAGNYIRKQIDVDVNALTPDTEGAFIPDPNLAAAIREALDYPPGKQITTFDITRLQTLTATNRSITDLTGLEHALTMETLDLSNNQIQDLTPLSALLQLRKMYLSANQISDITPLTDLTQLTELILGNPLLFDGATGQFKAASGYNEIRDITPLANLTKLTRLGLFGNKVHDLTPLANLTKLTSLHANYNEIRDVTPLENLINLENLVLQNNQISDIRPLKRLVRLWTLYLDGNNEIDDITALQDMTKLRYLQLGNSKIADLTPLSRLTGLWELDVRNNLITDITPLAKLTQLRALALFYNQITDLTPLANMTQLYELGLAYNQITDLMPLSRLTELNRVSLADNQITDLTPLSRLTKMESLGLGNNQISDVRPLLQLFNLKRLWVYGNPIQDRELLLTLKKRIPGITIYHIRGGDPLPVTLSSFKAVRTASGAIINWTTESEVDNAGFNILRSQTKTGEFKKINVKLIQGAGTTGERNTYTWTDTTAKPNTVYYYRIEDVSYAGEHNTLATTRLRGLVSAKNKMVTQWVSFKMGR